MKIHILKNTMYQFSISNASWVIVKSEYDGHCLQVDDKYDFYANPPLNWRKYLKESL
jgi:hypothetical protein